MDVTVRAGEMSHKVKGVPFEWGNGYGLVDHDDVQAASTSSAARVLCRSPNSRCV